MPPPLRSSLTAGELEAYNALSAQFEALDASRERYPASEVFGAMLNTPLVARAIVGVGMAIVGGEGEKVPPVLHQLGDMAMCGELHRLRRGGRTGCELRVMFNHLPEALEGGVRPAAIRALLAGDDGALTEEEGLWVAFVRGVLHGDLSEETMASMEARFGRRLTLEYGLLMLLVFYLTRVEDLVGCRAPDLAEVEARLEELAAAQMGGC